MLFQQMFYAKPLLFGNHVESLYLLIKKVNLSLVTFFASSVLAIEAGDIKNTPFLQCPPGTGGCLVELMSEKNDASYMNFAATPTSRTFDYDPSLLPEVAEAIFGLRIKHVNIGKELVINLSGNYLLKLGKEKIYILDTYTKNISVYKYQTTNPNITIGLGVSKGLPRNYKSITIKEDADGQLYNYAALYSDNIFTDEAMLSETLSHPFYDIVGQDGFKDDVDINKAMAFYQPQPSHERHARCVKSSRSIFRQIQDILAPGSPVCGPEAGSGILVANRNPVNDLKLEVQLVEADFKTSKLLYDVGYRLKLGLDVHADARGAVSFEASSIFCRNGFMGEIKGRRKKRDTEELDTHELLLSCVGWVHLVSFMFLTELLNYDNDRNVTTIMKLLTSLTLTKFTHYMYSKYKMNIDNLKQFINKHGEEIKQALALTLGMLSESAITLPEYRGNYRGIVDVKNAVINGTPALYEVPKEAFKPLPNEVYRIDKLGKTNLVDDEHYITHSMILMAFAYDATPIAQKQINGYLKTIKEWKTQFKTMVNNSHSETNQTETNKVQILQMQFILTLTEAIHAYLSRIKTIQYKKGVELINTVYHNGVLLGISVGVLVGREYQTVLQLSSPQALTHKEDGYRGVLAFLESEVVRDLFSHDRIDKASVVKIIPQGAAYPAEIDFHDEL